MILRTSLIPSCLSLFLVSQPGCIFGPEDLGGSDADGGASADGGGSAQPCASGTCEEVEIFADEQAFPLTLATDSTNLYWSTAGGNDVLGNPLGGAIWSKPLVGGEAKKLFSDLEQPFRIQVSASHVYWESDLELWRGAKEGTGEPELVYEDLDEDVRWRSALTADSVIVASGNYAEPVRVLKMNLDGSSQTELATIPSITSVQGLSVSGTTAYVLSQDMSGPVYAVPLEGGEPQLVSDQNWWAAGLQTEAGKVYTHSGMTDQIVRQTDIATGESLNLFNQDYDSHFSTRPLAVTDGHILVTYSKGRSGYLARAPKEPALPTSLWASDGVTGDSNGRPNASDIITNGDFVYWVYTGANEANTGQIWRMRWRQ